MRGAEWRPVWVSLSLLETRSIKRMTGAGSAFAVQELSDRSLESRSRSLAIGTRDSLSGASDESEEDSSLELGSGALSLTVGG